MGILQSVYVTKEHWLSLLFAIFYERKMKKCNFFLKKCKIRFARGKMRHPQTHHSTKKMGGNTGNAIKEVKKR